MDYDFTISVQVLNEMVNVMRRKYAKSWPEIDAALDFVRMAAGNVRPLTNEAQLAATKIAKRYGFSIYDSMIAASAIEADCNTLLSEDMQDGMVIENVLTIRNPFA